MKLNYFKNYTLTILFLILFGCSDSAHDGNTLPKIDISGDWEFFFYYSDDYENIGISEIDNRIDTLKLEIIQEDEIDVSNITSDIYLTDNNGTFSSGFIDEDTLCFFGFTHEQVPVVSRDDIFYSGKVNSGSNMIEGHVYIIRVESDGSTYDEQVAGITWVALKI